ncbi:hypothetical protein SAMN05445504_7127 [Burkholderia sp. CF099]|nr:hypothetical protein SAMN05445504_7127 [Burkholderia sp. CF099]
MYIDRSLPPELYVIAPFDEFQRYLTKSGIHRLIDGGDVFIWRAPSPQAA